MKRGPYKPRGRVKVTRKALLKQIAIDIAMLERALRNARAMQRMLAS